MFVWIPVALAVLVCLAFVLTGVAVNEDELFGIVSTFFGILLVTVLALSPMWNPSGLPLRDIDQGDYKVAFVYVAGDNVNVVVEHKTDKEASREEIVYYQFKKDAFEGTLNSNTKKLVVVQSESFKKLRLE